MYDVYVDRRVSYLLAAFVDSASHSGAEWVCFDVNGEGYPLAILLT